MVAIHGWGRYPVIDAEVSAPTGDISAISDFLKQTKHPVIARGMGRSYGDSSLSQHVVNCCGLNEIKTFDSEAGVLRCGAGVTLADLLTLAVPKGWFLQVAPGTKLVAVGGAIASDVHGKNHHLDGCFSEHVDSFDLMLAGGAIVTCSRNQNSDLFHATCGGMGLTGIIIEASLRLKRIRSSFVQQTTLKAKTLAEALLLFEAHRGATYSVAWIDCLATGTGMGRSIVLLGEHSVAGGISLREKPAFSVPFDLPRPTLNRYSIKIFNWLYYNKARGERSVRDIYYEPFFFPLDSIHRWNRLYGKHGFLQYQCVIPKAAGMAGLTTLLKKIVDSRRGSFLAVLKLFGPSNANLLSFPTEGYTLAVDLKLENGLLELLDELDAIVLAHGGRLYLAKDSRMNESTFKRSYLRWEEFQEIRSRYGALQAFSSLQSRRIGLG